VAKRTREANDGRPQPKNGAEVGPLRGLYEVMVLIRLFEEETERQYKKARIGGYCHLSSGQEASIVGSVAALEDEDVLFTAYRCHGHALARGVPPPAVMAELFGRVDGCARGRGGSMHLADPALGYLGGWGIVGGHLPPATGAAFALARAGKRHAVLCDLGEGAVNIGAWHESLNLAGIWDLPVVFVVMNNIYSMGSHVDRVSAEPEVHKRASGYRMEGVRVDGQDLEEVMEAAARLVRAREERRPSVLEAVTYRYRGHSVADAGDAYRTKEEIEEWHDQRDPIARFGRKLVERGVIGSQQELDEIRERADQQVNEAVEFAEQSEPPALDSLARHVYGDPETPEQFARMMRGSPFGERELVLGKELGHD
jgi:pyruvate dehydrogenase E1 component alpha subunit